MPCALQPSLASSALPCHPPPGPPRRLSLDASVPPLPRAAPAPVPPRPPACSTTASAGTSASSAGFHRSSSTAGATFWDTMSLSWGPRQPTTGALCLRCACGSALCCAVLSCFGGPAVLFCAAPAVLHCAVPVPAGLPACVSGPSGRLSSPPACPCPSPPLLLLRRAAVRLYGPQALLNLPAGAAQADAALTSAPANAAASGGDGSASAAAAATAAGVPGAAVLADLQLQHLEQQPPQQQLSLGQFQQLRLHMLQQHLVATLQKAAAAATAPASLPQPPACQAPPLASQQAQLSLLQMPTQTAGRGGSPAAELAPTAPAVLQQQPQRPDGAYSGSSSGSATAAHWLLGRLASLQMQQQRAVPAVPLAAAVPQQLAAAPPAPSNGCSLAGQKRCEPELSLPAPLFSPQQEQPAQQQEEVRLGLCVSTFHWSNEGAWELIQHHSLADNCAQPA